MLRDCTDISINGASNLAIFGLIEGFFRGKIWAPGAAIAAGYSAG